MWYVRGNLNVLLQSFLSTSIYRITVLNFKGWTFCHIYGHFQQHLYCACAETVFYELRGVNLDTAVRFLDPDFPLECKISGIWCRFPLIIAFYILNVRHISTSGFVWPTDLESIPHASTSTSIIPTRFEVDMTINCRVTAFMSADTSRYLWPWPLTFWPWTVVVHGGSCDQPCHQVLRPVCYLWKCVRGHCACTESRDP